MSSLSFDSLARTSYVFKRRAYLRDVPCQGLDLPLRPVVLLGEGYFQPALLQPLQLSHYTWVKDYSYSWS